MLLRGGMPLAASLDMGAELLHPLLRERLAAASRAISEGRNVSQSLEANGLTTPVALRMIAVGEKGGNMGEMLEQVATFHDEELARWVDWFTRLFEPILMAVIGLVIGAIVVLMYMPIFELAGNLRWASSRRPFPSTRSPARAEPPQRRGGAWPMGSKSNSPSSPTASPGAS